MINSFLTNYLFFYLRRYLYLPTNDEQENFHPNSFTNPPTSPPNPSSSLILGEDVPSDQDSSHQSTSTSTPSTSSTPNATKIPSINQSSSSHPDIKSSSDNKATMSFSWWQGEVLLQNVFIRTDGM
jgi:hypothetical protein